MTLQSLIETQEKELLTCRNCGAVITTKKHFEFMHHKLGPKAYASFLNLNALNERLELARETEVDVEVTDELKRKDMFNVLCPNCLRQVLVKNLK
jgi:hydrogenase-4 component H